MDAGAFADGSRPTPDPNPGRGGEKIKKKQRRMGYALPALLFSAFLSSGEYGQPQIANAST